MKDPIVEEIRKFRDSYAKRFNYDSLAMYEDIKKKEEQAEKKAKNLLLSNQNLRKKSCLILAFVAILFG